MDDKMTGSTFPDLDSMIADRKKTSKNYRKWQECLELRDRIYREVGSCNSSIDRVRKLIKVWHARWEEECRTLDPKPSEETMKMLSILEAEIAAEEYAT